MLDTTVAEYENEVAQLDAEIATLGATLATATATAETAIALAERTGAADHQAAAVDAEHERERLALLLKRKRLAQQAAVADLATARKAQAQTQRQAEIDAIRADLDKLAQLAQQLDAMPISPEVWAALKGLADHVGALYRQAGGQGRLLDDPAAARGRVWSAHATNIDCAMGLRSQAPGAVPTLATLLGIDRARGLVTELMNVN